MKLNAPNTHSKHYLYNKRAVYNGWVLIFLVVLLAIGITYYVIPKKGGTKNQIINYKTKLTQLVQANKMSEASLLTDSIIDSSPESYIGYYLKSKVVINKSLKAQLLKKAISKFDISLPELNECGNTLYDLNDFRGASIAYNNSIKRSPNDSVHLALGKIYIDHLSNYEEGLINLRSCLILDSTYNNSYELNEKMGLAYLKLSKYRLSINCFKKASTIDPLNGIPEYYIGKIKFIQGDVGQACDTWKKSEKKGSTLTKYAIKNICQ